MNNILHLTLSIRAVGKQRARRDRSGKWYNPQSHLMARVKKDIRQQLPEHFEIIGKDVPITVNIYCYFKPLKSERKAYTNKPYLKKADKDNIEKLLLDCMEKIIFTQDQQVFSGTFEKRYGEENLIEIEVRW